VAEVEDVAPALALEHRVEPPTRGPDRLGGAQQQPRIRHPTLPLHTETCSGRRARPSAISTVPIQRDEIDTPVVKPMRSQQPRHCQRYRESGGCRVVAFKH